MSEIFHTHSIKILNRDGSPDSALAEKIFNHYSAEKEWFKNNFSLSQKEGTISTQGRFAVKYLEDYSLYSFTEEICSRFNPSYLYNEGDEENEDFQELKHFIFSYKDGSFTREDFEYVFEDDNYYIVSGFNRYLLDRDLKKVIIYLEESNTCSLITKDEEGNLYICDTEEYLLDSDGNRTRNFTDFVKRENEDLIDFSQLNNEDIMTA